MNQFISENNCPHTNFVFALAICVIFSISGSAFGNAPQWVGKAKYRLLVRVEPVEALRSRKSDEMPTSIELSGDELRKLAGISGKIDVPSIQVEQYDTKNGDPIPYLKWAYAAQD